MRKQIVDYTSPLDGLIALAQQLTRYELQYQQDWATSPKVFRIFSTS
jgi:hypothetical protein